MQLKRATSRVEVGPSGFLSFSDVDLGVCLQFQTGSQVSSYVEAWNSAFLSSCKRGFRLPVELNWGPGAFLKFATRVSVLPSCCELILGVPFESVQRNQPHLEWRGKSVSLDLWQTHRSSPVSRRDRPPFEVRRGLRHSFPD